jgi:hypothetical protein
VRHDELLERGARLEPVLELQVGLGELPERLGLVARARVPLDQRLVATSRARPLLPLEVELGHVPLAGREPPTGLGEHLARLVGVLRGGPLLQEGLERHDGLLGPALVLLVGGREEHELARRVPEVRHPLAQLRVVRLGVIGVELDELAVGLGRLGEAVLLELHVGEAELGEGGEGRERVLRLHVLEEARRLGPVLSLRLVEAGLVVALRLRLQLELAREGGVLGGARGEREHGGEGEGPAHGAGRITDGRAARSRRPRAGYRSASS